MRILVTGGSGFIGRNIVTSLTLEKHEVIILDTYCPPPELVYSEYVQGSILDRNILRDIFSGVDVVYHIAGSSNINHVRGNPVSTIETNVLGTTYLLEEARRNLIKRFIFAGSYYCFGTRGHLYTTTKRASEMIIKNYNYLYRVPYTLLRYGTVYGPGSNDDNVISSFFNRAISGNDLIINGDGRQTRDFVYIKDIIDGSVGALGRRFENTELMIISEQQTSIRDLAQLIIDTTNSKSQIIVNRIGERFDDFDSSAINFQLSARQSVWNTRYDLQFGLRKFFDYLKF